MPGTIVHVQDQGLGAVPPVTVDAWAGIAHKFEVGIVEVPIPAADPHWAGGLVRFAEQVTEAVWLELSVNVTVPEEFPTAVYDLMQFVSALVHPETSVPAPAAPEKAPQL